MTSIQTISRRSLDELETGLISLSARINAAEYEFLVLVREFDLRQGWKACHCNNCAEWLDMKCGIAANTAREKVRVARALFDLPVVSGAFRNGNLSYSKVRSLSRIATPQTEEKLVDYALAATARQVEHHCTALRNANRELSTVDAQRLHAQRFLNCSAHGDGSMTITVELPREQGELVMKALEYAMAELDGDSGVEQVVDPGADEVGMDYGDALEVYYDGETASPKNNGTFFQQQADALVRVAQGYLAGGKNKTSCTADHYQVVVHAAAVAVGENALREASNLNAPREAPDENAPREAPDQNAPRGASEENAPRGARDGTSKSDLPIESVRRLCCDASLVTVTEDEKGSALHVGRKHRTVPPALRRALYARDKACRFPGCTHERWLSAHHVVHWADGGETSLDNTLLLCSSHHRLLHEGGYRITADCDGEWQFALPVG